MYSKLIFILFGICSWIFAFGHEAIHGNTIYIVQEGWHTGIILETVNVDHSNWSGMDGLRDYKYLDVGWGDE